MTTYAQIIDGQIAQVASAPTAPGVGPDGTWTDFTDPAVLAAYLADGGWVEVVETDAPTTEHRTTSGVALVDDVPTRVWTVWDDTARIATTDGGDRPYTDEENAVADASVVRDAMLTDIDARLTALEEFVYGKPETPTDTTGIKTWGEWGGMVPHGQFMLSSTGKIYKNVSGVPLTTPIDDFPGSPGQWAHLWQEVSAAAPVEPEPPTSEAPQWTEGTSYDIGDEVMFNGTKYRCIQAHNSQAGWTPAAVPALWSAV